MAGRPPSRVLVAGASGRLGRWVVGRLKDEGHFVRALSRRPGRLEGIRPDEIVRGDLRDRPSLVGSCAGTDAVISCAGASLQLSLRGNRASYMDVDFHGNRNLLSAAEAEGVERFVYVSVHATPELSETEYVQAHERFVTLLGASSLRRVVVRPTGFFYVFAELLTMACRGIGLVIGSGDARTNPIHEADVADLCVEALQTTEADLAAGGPSVYTRREIAELAFQVLSKRPRVVPVPPWIFRSAASLLAPANPRMAALLRFGVVASTHDVIAPARGDRDLRAYFEARAHDSRGRPITG